MTKKIEKSVGKIIFYNQSTGNGVIISRERKKALFDISQWNEFKYIPKAGILVSFLWDQETAIDIEYHNDSTQQEDEHKEVISVETYNNKIPPNLSDEDKQIFLKPLANKEIEKLDLTKILKDGDKALQEIDKPITISLDLPIVISQYFTTIKEELQKRQGYNKVQGRLHYFLIKRFLWTMFNNLNELDNKIMTPRIQSIATDLRYMDAIQKDFDRKSQNFNIAYEDLFLSVQSKYKSVKELLDEAKRKITTLTQQTDKIEQEKELLRQKILNTSKKDAKEQLNRKLKKINGAYSDTVHMLAQTKKLTEILFERTHTFEKQFRNNFNNMFQEQAKKYTNKFEETLNAQAFLLDYELWREAKVSEVIRMYFHNLTDPSEFNTKTYLKYYLDTLDVAKMSTETKKLYELYQYLEKVFKKSIILLSDNTQNILDFKHALSPLSKKYEIATFTKEIDAFQYAKRKEVQLIILEDINLKGISFVEFLYENITPMPIILFITDYHYTTKEFTTVKYLPESVLPQKLLHEVEKLL